MYFQVIRISLTKINKVSGIQPSPLATTTEVLTVSLPGSLWQNYMNQCVKALFKVTDIYWSVFIIRSHWPAYSNNFGRSECAARTLPPSPSRPPFPGRATGRGVAYLSW
ncbi:hypothetical protein PAMP_011970 [Pampus punctatissimus]